MEGHESLAQWIAGRECDYFARFVPTASFGDLCNDHRIPSWLQKDLREAKTLALSCTMASFTGIHGQWGAGCGVRRMTLALLGHIPGSTLNKVAIELKNNDVNAID